MLLNAFVADVCDIRLGMVGDRITNMPYGILGDNFCAGAIQRVLPIVSSYFWC